MDFVQAVQFHEETKKYGSILGLWSIRKLMHELGDVWKQLKIVHIAGTNGKGSVCCFMSAALKEAGYLVGQYSSPAVFDLREVYQINGEWISKEEYAACMQSVADACGRMEKQGMMHPTVFEVETALAFLWFYRKKCDVVLLETGMGGATDATNLIKKPLCCVFTSISVDHTAFLGNTLSEIAGVKAGIIKEGCPVVTTEQKPEVKQVLKQYAGRRHASFLEAEQMREIQMEHGTLRCIHPLLGSLTLSMAAGYQAENAALAIAALLELHKCGYSVSKETIRKSLGAAVWPGRFECICKSPLFYIDGAHNPDAAKKLKDSLFRHFPGMRRIGIMGVMADKPYGRMLEILLPLFEKIYTVTPKNPRSLPAQSLAEEITRRGGAACASDSVAEACQNALRQGGDIIIAFGSLFFLNEVRQVITCKKKGGDLL